MKKLLNAFKLHPTHFVLVICSHILLILVIVHCTCTDLFNIFTPSSFCPSQSTQLSEEDANSQTTDNSRNKLEALYNKGTRYVRCTIPTLYYSGYDNTSFGKVTGHYYYSLDDSSCTIYLLPVSICKNSDSVHMTLTDLTFNARLNRSDANLKDLLRYISADINWNYYSLSKCAGSIVVDQTMYSTTEAFVFINVIIILSLINIVQIINIKKLIH